MGTISHFGECCCDGQYTLVSCLFASRCLPCPAAICKSGCTPPCSVVPDRLSGARSLGDGVVYGDLRDGSPLVWYRGKALVGSGALPLFPATGSTCPVPYGVGATVSDILMVNPASVMDVSSLYTHSASWLDLLL